MSPADLVKVPHLAHVAVLELLRDLLDIGERERDRCPLCNKMHDAGVWSHERKGARLSVRVTSFRAMAQATRALVREEADDLGRFLGTAVVSTRFS